MSAGERSRLAAHEERRGKDERVERVICVREACEIRLCRAGPRVTWLGVFVFEMNTRRETRGTIPFSNANNA